MKRLSLSLRRAQQGMTLVELLVALALGLVVVLIAATALLLGQQGYRAVDDTTQLRDRERFAVDLISRVLIQAGYQDFGAANITVRSTAALLGTDPEPDIFGWNNAVYANPGTTSLIQSTTITNDNRPTVCSVNDTSCKNGSDVLAIRFQGVTSPTTTSTLADNTMINCAGLGETGLSLTNPSLDQRATSIFHVTRGLDGEPSLSCSYYDFAANAWSSSTPMIQGVETFQVLYGTDAVSPGVVPSTTATQDTVADRWLRADELTVAGNLPATRENWRRVRAVRVGLVLRGGPGSAQQSLASTLTPLGTLFTSTNDTGSSLAVAADRRLRLQSTFTVHMRNDMTLR